MSTISFRAGRAQRQGETNTVVSEPGRGLISLYTEQDLLHFTYKDIASSATDDLILFPGDATFSLAAPRVAVLKFASSSTRHFFWFQDLDPAQDAARIQQVNEMIGGDSDPEAPAAIAPVEPLLPVVAAPAASSSLGTNEQMQSLQRLLDGMSGNAAQSAAGPEFTLSSMLKPTAVAPLLAPHLSSLAPHLPSSLPPTTASLQRAIASPDFRRAVSSFDRALRTGALGPLISGLGLDQNAAVGVEEFLAGIQKQADAEKERDGNMQTD